MSNQNYITDIINLKEKNIIFKENFYKKEKIKGITHKLFEGYLSYEPKCCTKCGVVFDENFEKHGFITSNIKIPNVSGFKSILKLHKYNLPKVLSFDEFKSVKSADGAMSFHMCDGITGQTIDIVEGRRLDNLIKYFLYYDYKTRSRVEFIIIDKFHLTQLISRSLNKTRIMAMKLHKKHHRKFKRYWRLILKSREDLDVSKWKRFTCFDSLMTEADVVNFLINLDDKLKQIYLFYQDLLFSFKNKNYNLLKRALHNDNSNISSYMKTSIKTLLEFLPFI